MDSTMTRVTTDVFLSKAKLLLSWFRNKLQRYER